eukprot:EG_transcript_39253
MVLSGTPLYILQIAAVHSVMVFMLPGAHPPPRALPAFLTGPGHGHMQGPEIEEHTPGKHILGLLLHHNGEKERKEERGTQNPKTAPKRLSGVEVEEPARKAVLEGFHSRISHPPSLGCACGIVAKCHTSQMLQREQEYFSYLQEI